MKTNRRMQTEDDRWIDDRKPGSMDANHNGSVAIPADVSQGWVSRDWGVISLGQPWSPFPCMGKFRKKEVPFNKISDFGPFVSIWIKGAEAEGPEMVLAMRENKDCVSLTTSSGGCTTGSGLRWAKNPNTPWDEWSPMTKKNEG